MTICGLERNRKSLGRGVARQAIDHAARDSADMAHLVAELHHMAPNRRNRERFAGRLSRRSGVLAARVGDDGLTLDMRSVIDVTVHRDGADAFEERRIRWMRVRVRAKAGRYRIGFDCFAADVSFHALQRRFERSSIGLDGFLGRLDLSMRRGLGRLERDEILLDRGDQYLSTREGVWAGRAEQMASNPAWGPAFADTGRAIPVFSVRTFLGEEEMRSMVWLGWSSSARQPIAA